MHGSIAVGPDHAIAGLPSNGGEITVDMPAPTPIGFKDPDNPIWPEYRDVHTTGSNGPEFRIFPDFQQIGDEHV